MQSKYDILLSRNITWKIKKINISINKIDIDIDFINIGFNEMYNVKPWKSELVPVSKGRTQPSLLVRIITTTQFLI